jgi:hypothetical protein
LKIEGSKVLEGFRVRRLKDRKMPSVEAGPMTDHPKTVLSLSFFLNNSSLDAPYRVKRLIQSYMKGGNDDGR